MPEPATDLRETALLAALAVTGRDAERLLARHPDGERLTQRLGNAALPPLNQLLAEELHQREAQLDLAAAEPVPDATAAAFTRTVPAVEYWARRRRLQQLESWHTGYGQLAPFWKTLLSMSASEVRDTCTVVGADLLAAAGQGVDPDKLIAWLGPMGVERARMVIDRIKGAAAPAPPDADDLRRAVRSRYRKAVRRRADRALVTIGQAALAALYQHLPAPQRGVAVKAGRSNLPAALEQTVPLKRLDETTLADLGRWMTDRLGLTETGEDA